MTKRRCIMILSVLAVWLLMCPIADAVEVTIITLKNEVSTSGDVLLSDIVENFWSIPAIAPYASLVVATKPPLHGIRTVTGRQVEAMLRQRGLTGIKVEGDYVRITAAKQAITSERLVKFLTDEIARWLNKKQDDVWVTVGGTERYVPVGELRLAVELPDTLRKGGTMIAKMMASVDDETVVWTTPITVRFRKEVVVVASEPIRRNQPLDANNLDVITTWVEDETAYPALADLVGYVAATYLQVGRIIKNSDVMIPHLVTPGQNVTIMYIGRNFSVEAPGVVLEKGYFGDWVRVNNQETQKTVKARVASPSLVTVIEND